MRSDPQRRPQRTGGRVATAATSGTCVEVAELTGGHRAIRDSKDPAGPALAFAPGEWAAFTAGVRSGEFD